MGHGLSPVWSAAQWAAGGGGHRRRHHRRAGAPPTPATHRASGLGTGRQARRAARRVCRRGRVVRHTAPLGVRRPTEYRPAPNPCARLRWRGANTSALLAACGLCNTCLPCESCAAAQQKPRVWANKECDGFRKSCTIQLKNGLRQVIEFHLVRLPLPSTRRIARLPFGGSPLWHGTLFAQSRTRICMRTSTAWLSAQNKGTGCGGIARYWEGSCSACCTLLHMCPCCGAHLETTGPHQRQ